MEDCCKMCPIRRIGPFHAVPSPPIFHDFMRDLTLPEYLPAETPFWLQEAFPPEVEPFRGINGMSPEWREAIPSANAMGTAGIDRFQANQYINWRPETAHFLEARYTPLSVPPAGGRFPLLEAIAEQTARGCVTVEAVAEALCKEVVARLRHPHIPPFSAPIRADRNLGDEALLQSGAAWCNEQARVFVRLCQIRQIPARIIHLFYTTVRNGHTIAEFHNGAQWCLVDASYGILFRDEAGHPLSAVQCHDRGEGQERFGALFHARLQELLHSIQPEDEHSRNWIESRSKETPHSCAAALDWFGVINYPLPPLV